MTEPTFGTQILSAVICPGATSHYSTGGAGGYHELPSLTRRDTLPVDAAGRLHYDSMGSGHRRQGMLVIITTDADPAKWPTYRLQVPGYAQLDDEQRLAGLANNANWKPYSAGAASPEGGTVATHEVTVDSINELATEAGLIAGDFYNVLIIDNEPGVGYQGAATRTTVIYTVQATGPRSIANLATVFEKQEIQNEDDTWQVSSENANPGLCSISEDYGNDGPNGNYSFGYETLAENQDIGNSTTYLVVEVFDPSENHTHTATFQVGSVQSAVQAGESYGTISSESGGHTHRVTMRYDSGQHRLAFTIADPDTNVVQPNQKVVIVGQPDATSNPAEPTQNTGAKYLGITNIHGDDDEVIQINNIFLGFSSVEGITNSYYSIPTTLVGSAITINTPGTYHFYPSELLPTLFTAKDLEFEGPVIIKTQDRVFTLTEGAIVKLGVVNGHQSAAFIMESYTIEPTL